MKLRWQLCFCQLRQIAAALDCGKGLPGIVRQQPQTSRLSSFGTIDAAILRRRRREALEKPFISPSRRFARVSGVKPTELRICWFVTNSPRGTIRIDAVFGIIFIAMPPYSVFAKPSVVSPTRGFLALSRGDYIIFWGSGGTEFGTIMSYSIQEYIKGWARARCATGAYLLASSPSHIAYLNNSQKNSKSVPTDA